MDETLLTDAAQQLLREVCQPAAVRAIEHGNRTLAATLWEQILASGFPDALVPEADGGAGLSLAQITGLLAQCGAHALPLPLADTVVARMLLSRCRHAHPDGPIALAQGERLADGSIRALVHGGGTADAVLVDTTSGWLLLPMREADCKPHAFVLDCIAHWQPTQAGSAPRPDIRLPDGLGLRTLQAATLSAQISGALSVTLHLSLLHANDRHQFGRPIGKFQAIQHRLAIMSQHTFAARIAAQLGCASPTPFPDPLRAATAKARCSQAAQEVAAAAHAIHGAIGITAEHPLHLLTRRLHAWRQTAGSESYWQHVVGSALLSQPGRSLDTVRRITDIHDHA